MSRTDDGSSVAKRAQTLGRRCLSGEVVGEDREPVIVKAGRRRDRLEAFKAAPESEFARVFANLPEAPALEGSERVSPLIGKLDMPNAHRPAAAAGVAFTGDAAMAADPMWAVGCGWALQSAEWLADHAGPARASSTVPCPDTGGFTGAASSPTTWRAPATRRDGACCRTSASS